MKYYEVVAKCGHVGRNKYYEGHFFIIADSEKNAAEFVKRKPRVKRNHEDSILSVEEVTYKEYIDGLVVMEKNPYFNCKSKHEQKEKLEEINANVHEETSNQIKYRKLYRKDYKKKRSTYTNIYIKRKRMRNPYKYQKMNNNYENELVEAYKINNHHENELVEAYKINKKASYNNSAMKNKLNRHRYKVI